MGERRTCPHDRADLLDPGHDRARNAPLIQVLRGGTVRPRGFGTPLDNAFAKLLLDGKVDQARDLLERQAPLSIFGARDHGGLLLTAGLTRRAIQYDFGNPLTAAGMTRHVLSAALYAPIRVLLREDTEGRVAFEYDRPVTTFGQFGKPEVDEVATNLDDQLRTVLAAAAG